MSETTAEKLRAMMARRGMTQCELARRAGTHSASVSKYCRGIKVPSEDVLERIAKALDVKPESLRGNEPYKHRKTSIPTAVSRLLEQPDVEIRLEKGKYALIFDVVEGSPLHEFVKNAARAKRMLKAETLDAEMYRDVIDGLKRRYERDEREAE